jgi:hypothetical protein
MKKNVDKVDKPKQNHSLSGTSFGGRIVDGVDGRK